tara:strand:- start:4005 stop:4190 length:186 start_codon:yes stop_codon:yes gene_type:complete
MPVLDEQDLESINAALDASVQTEEELQLAKEAGLDVEAQERKLNETTQRLRRIKAVYFPNA